MWRTTSPIVLVVVLKQLSAACHPYWYKAEAVKFSNWCPKMERPRISEQLKRAKEECLWGLFIADAVAMPVHWYYNTDDIKYSYGGWLKGYKAPNKKHPTSILTISNSGGSGRTAWSGKTKEVIGNVILHDKLPYWTSKDKSIHYHQGMSAGDNTLNPTMVLQMLNTMNRVDPHVQKAQGEVRKSVMEDYVKFMTTPGSHNDTYCESFHRSFFKDWIAIEKSPVTGEQIVDFAEQRLKKYAKQQDDSQLLAIGALIPAIPWVLRSAHLSESECVKSTIDFIKLTHPVKSLIPFIELYSSLLHSVLNGADLRSEILKVAGDPVLGGQRTKEDLIYFANLAQRNPKGSEERLKIYQKAVSNLGLACYIDGAMASMLFLAYEFSEDFEGGVLANANCGGENCHRGGALGALLGAASVTNGHPIPQNWKDNLGLSKLPLQKIITNLKDV